MNQNASYSFLTPPQAADELGWLGVYRVLRVLGIGGTSIVFEAADPEVARSVAVKVLRPDRARERTYFLRGAEAMAGLAHERVVAIHEIGEFRGALYLVMPHLRGESMEDRLRRKVPVPLLDALRMGREIAEGLAAIHARGLVHGKLTAGKVWLESAARGVASVGPQAEAGCVKLLDVGRGGGDFHDDLFALGGLLYRMTTGAAPDFERTDASGYPRPPDEINIAMPPVLSRLILCLLARRPADRPASAQGVADALRELAESLTVQRSVDPGDADDGPRGVSGELTWHRRMAPRWVLTGVTLMVLVSAVLYFRSWQLSGIRGQRPVVPDEVKPEPVVVVDGPLPLPIAPPPVFPHGPSPLDRLDAAQVPATERFEGQPRELVAVIGSQRQRHWGNGYALAASPDGKEVATAAADGIRFWDATTLEPRGGPLASPDQALAYFTLAYIAGPGGPRLAAATDRLFLTARRTGTLPEGDVVVRPGWVIRSLAASADGGRLAIAGEGGSVAVWDVAGPAPRAVVTLKPAWPTVNSSQGCALSADGKRLAYLREEQIVRVVEAGEPGGAEVALLEHDVPVMGMQFAPGGRRLAVECWDGTIALWDLDAAKPVKRAALAAFEHPVSVRFSPDGRHLAVSHWDVQIWDIEQARIVQTLPHGRHGLTSVAFTAGGKGLITLSGSIVRRWDLTAMQPRQEPALAPESYLVGKRGGVAAVFSPDGSRVAARTIEGRARLWDLTGASPVEVGPWQGTPTLVRPTAFAPDGKTLATFDDGPPQLQLWNLAGPAPRLTNRVADNEFYWVDAFSLDGRRAYGTEAGTRLRVWDASGPELRVLSTVEAGMGAHGMRVRSDGQLLARFGDLGAELWDLSADIPRRRALLHLKESVNDVAFAPDAKSLACAGDMKGGLALWDLTGPEPRRLSAPAVEQGAVSICFTPDGGHLLWADSTGTLTLWDLKVQGVARQWRLPGPVDRVFIPPDGRHILTHNSNGTVYVLRLAPPGEARSQ